MYTKGNILFYFIVLIFNLSCFAQNKPDYNVLLTDVLKFKESFHTNKFDIQQTLKNNPGWSAYICEQPAPPTVIDDFIVQDAQGNVSPQKKFVDRYKYRSDFINKNHVIVRIAHNDFPAKEFLVNVDSEDINLINEFSSYLKKVGKKIPKSSDYLFQKCYFRLNETAERYLGNTLVKCVTFSLISINQYPSGFEEKIAK